jgi:hypothetical protein
MVEICITDLQIEKGNISDNEYRIYRGIKHILREFAETLALEFLITGLIIPEISYAPISKDKLKKMGVKKYEAITVPIDMWVLPAEQIKINSSWMSSKPSYFLEIPDELIYFVTTKGIFSDGTKDEAAYYSLTAAYPELIANIQKGVREIKIETNLDKRRRPLSDSPYPTPYLYSVLEILKHKRALRRMDYSLAARVITAIQHIKMGDKDFPVTEGDQEMVDQLKEQMSWRNSGYIDTERVFQLFTNHTINIEWVFPDVSVLLNERKYADVNADIFFGLGFPKILTTGETDKSNSSDPEFASLSPVKTMEMIRRVILDILNSILEQVVELNGFKSIPVISFSNINFHSFKNFVEGMNILYNSGNISRTSFTAAFGYNWEEEVKIKADENTTMEELGVGKFAELPFSPQPDNNPINQNIEKENAINNDKK